MILNLSMLHATMQGTSGFYQLLTLSIGKVQARQVFGASSALKAGGNMTYMRVIAAIIEDICIVIIAFDAFETIVLPRRVVRKVRVAKRVFATRQLGSLGDGRQIAFG